jgi:hypothetical protein
MFNFIIPQVDYLYFDEEKLIPSEIDLQEIIERDLKEEEFRE